MTGVTWLLDGKIAPILVPVPCPCSAHPYPHFHCDEDARLARRRFEHKVAP